MVVFHSLATGQRERLRSGAAVLRPVCPGTESSGNSSPSYVQVTYRLREHKLKQAGWSEAQHCLFAG